jgi:DNA-directed RNA polymerase alpha subunit
MQTIDKLTKDLLIKQFNELKIDTFEELENVVNYLQIKINSLIHPFLEKSIYDIGLSVRAFNIIMAHLQKKELYDRINEEPKVKHITKISLTELIKERNIGQKSISEIEYLLSNHGYSLTP